jgi:DNA-binding protein HU-beta
LIKKFLQQHQLVMHAKTVQKCLTTNSILAICVQTHSTRQRISYPIPRKLGKKMTKAELIDAVAQKAGVSKADAERTIGSFFELVVASAKNGEKVAWPGFGSFSTSSRKARTGRNPQTGAPVQVPASIAMKFTSSSTLKSELNPNRK